MGIDIRSVRDDELPAFFDAMSTAFLNRFDVEKAAEEVRPSWDLARAHVAVDGDRIVGTFRSWTTELTVPGGGQMAASAISHVTVLPTHRRRGILRGLIREEHRGARARGEVAALLYAAEYPIYGRFGYGPACRVATWTVDTRLASMRRDPGGSIELLRVGADAQAIVSGVYDAWRVERAGEIARLDAWWTYALGLRGSARGPRWNRRLAVRRDSAGAVDGYVRYRTDEKWEQSLPVGTVIVDELVALTDDADAALWRYLVSIDLVTTVKAGHRRVSERFPWLLVNARAAQASEIADGMWVRLLDVGAALAARTYEREDRLILEVVDDDPAGGRTRVILDGGPAGSTARETTESPDLTVGVAALGAAYLGGARLRDAVAAAGADEHRTGALRRADALLRTADEPWGSTEF